MRVLFVHRHFPGQFRNIIRHLAQSPGFEVLGIGEQSHADSDGICRTYVTSRSGSAETHNYLRLFEEEVLRGQAVARACLALRREGKSPDVVVAHPGWGEALFLKDIFPNARHIYYFEYFYGRPGSDMFFDPEFAGPPEDLFRARIRNASNLLALEAADVGLAPTWWQHSLLPLEFQPKIRVFHDGIRTDIVKPDPSADFHSNKVGFRLSQDQEIVTYVARALEPCRGFHMFMRALPEIMSRRPGVQVLVVGDDKPVYQPAKGEPLRDSMLRELGGSLDLQRLHFLGHLPYEHYLKVLQLSSVHVYLTYPFVLSWSMMEAMSAECCVVASRTTPVEEVIEDEVSGKLVSFFSPDELATAVVSMLENPEKARSLGRAARRRITQFYDFGRSSVPQWMDLLQGG